MFARAGRSYLYRVLFTGLVVGMILLPLPVTLAQSEQCGGGEPPAGPPGPEDEPVGPPIPQNCFGGGPPGPTDCTDDGCVIDLLVVYTADARDGATNAGEPIEDLIARAVIETNLAYANSEIDTYARVVALVLVDYTESGNSSTDLANLRLNSDSNQDPEGLLDEVHDLRDQFYGDAVIMIVETMEPGIAGRARVSVVNGAGRNAEAFAVVKRASAASPGAWTFAHELAHIQGSNHEVAEAGGASAFSYSNGFLHPGGNDPFKTIMTTRAPSGPRRQNFSNPEVLYLGQPTGVPIDAPCDPVENPNSCPAHNALSINNTASVVARYRKGDCNRNGVCDAEDVAAGTSPDCNANQVPDECESDCNVNQIPDSCDISTGTSPDCNGNGVPDECDPYEDCNGNSVRDLCDINCAETGSPAFFECDPTNGLCGLSDDCNGNCIPDECEIAGSCSGVNPCCSSFFPPGGCECPRCCAAVCQIFPPCCTSGWDVFCALCAATIPVCACGLTGVCLDFDCNENQILDECDITSGTSSDCNANEIPDECETTVGISDDCNANNVPDECDLTSGFSQDCNSNNIPDECDISSGTIQDCNNNGVPDDCDNGCGLLGVCCNNECVECCDDSDCAGHPLHPYCRLSDHTCICLTDADCDGGVCTSSGTCCIGSGCVQN